MTRIHWLDLLIAPLRLLERTRGWRRLVLLLAYTLIMGVGGVLVGREVVLWQIPESPEPFDLARYGHVDLADSDNAMVLYRLATSLVAHDSPLLRDLPSGAGNQWDWTAADPGLRTWAEGNREAVAVWLAGSDRPDALSTQPEEFRISTPLSPLSHLRTLAQLGTLEATRRRASGDLEGAWTYHRAVIRSALHVCRHAGIAASLIGSSQLRLANPALLAWVEDPRLTPALLRRASGDLAGCRGLSTTATDAVRVEYFSDRAALQEPNRWVDWKIDPGGPDAWYHHLEWGLWGRNFLRNEPKRSLKILRLLAAGQLAQCDRPRGDRPPLVAPNSLVYAIDASTPASLARIRPETLAAWADASGCRVLMLGFHSNQASAQTTANLVDHLRLRVAERCYALEHGGQAPTRCGDLVPEYLDQLPVGIAPGDLLAAP